MSEQREEVVCAIHERMAILPDNATAEDWINAVLDAQAEWLDAQFRAVHEHIDSSVSGPWGCTCGDPDFDHSCSERPAPDA